MVAPVTLRERLPALIRREIDGSTGRAGHLIFKMNALEDKAMIQLLYRGFARGSARSI